MTQIELDSVADFLNRKYEERRSAAWKDGRRYPMARFAQDVGIVQSTMSRYMKLGPEKGLVEGMDTPLLMKFYDAFGDEFMQAMRGDAAVTSVKQDAKKEAKKKGAGGT